MKKTRKLHQKKTMITDKNKTEQKLGYIYDQMDIPKERRELSEVNLLWFLRVGSIQNHRHPLFQESLDCVKQLLKRTY